MKLSDIMSAAGLSWYAEVAMVLFILAFLIIVWRVFRPSQRAEWEKQARMPLDDDHPVTPRRGRE